MRSSDIPLSQTARTQIADALNLVVADALDLQGRVKTAHWNLRGVQFLSLHPFFDQLAAELGNNIDEVAERVMTLGGVTDGTAASVVKVSRMPAFKPKDHSDSEYAQRVLEAVGEFLSGVNSARKVAEGQGDPDTVDMLTEVVSLYEKRAWFLRATLDK
jgi:starvation-inducible DNA-binding protein